MTLTAAGSPYTGSSVTINPGVTVTVEPGAVVKLTGSLTVNGTLDVNGTAANPATFTSSSDSAPGQWSGITLNSSSSSIDHAEIRYGSTGVSAATGVSPAITNSTVRNNSGTAISLGNSASSTAITGNTLANNATGISTSGGSPEIANNTLRDCTSSAISFSVGRNQTGEVRIHDNLIERCGTATAAAISVSGRAGYDNSVVTGTTLANNTIRDGGLPIRYFVDPYVPPNSSTIPPDIDENTLSGNTSNAIWVSGRVAQSTAWENRGYPIVPMGGFNVRVASGATLTLGPGLVLKPYQFNAQINVDGSLVAQGTAAEPITFTSIKDDSVGGDTNGDGAASQPAAGDWSQLNLNATAGNPALQHIEVRYGSTVTSAGPVSLTDSTYRNNQGAFSTAGGSPQITGNTFTSNGGAVSVSNGSATITNNTLTGNGNGISASRGSPEIANNTIQGCSATGYGIYYSIVNSTNTQVNGEVRIHDNLVDGCGAPGSSSPLPSSYAAISVYGSQFNTTITGATLGGNTIRNGGRAIDYYVNPGSTIPADIDENTLSGNSSNAIWVSGKVAQSTTWQNRGYPIVPRGGYNLKVATGATLTLGPGLLLKPYQFNADINVDGNLDAQGTAADPITFTSIKDDSLGGDTNGDGTATQPGAGDWRTLSFTEGNATQAPGRGTLDYVKLRYGAAGSSCGQCGGGGPMVRFGPQNSGGPTSTPSIIRRSDFRYGYGAALTGAGALSEITDSTFASNGSAISIDAKNSSAVITGNTITSSGSGIGVGGGSPVIANNSISDCNGGYGISYNAGLNTTGQINIHHNTVDRCGAPASSSPSPSSFAAISVYAREAFNNTTVTGVTLASNTVRDGGRAIDYYVDPGSSTIPADIDENTLTGNASNAIWVSGRVDQSTTWENHGFAMVPRGGYNLKVATAATLTLGPGLVLKPYQTNANIDVWGTLNAPGESGNPITFTSIKDDSVGGDTNGDGGATSPAPGDWNSISLGYKNGTTAGAGTFDHVKAAYGNLMFSLYYAPSCGCDRLSTITHSSLRGANYGIYVSGNPAPGLEPDLSDNTIKNNTYYAVYKGGSSILDIRRVDNGKDIMDRSGPNAFTTNIAGHTVGANNDCQGAEQDDECPYGSDPVSLATGAFTYDHTDLSLSSKGDPLILRRVYNSGDPQDIGFGPAWSHSGLATALEQESGDVLVRHLSGARDLYVKTGSSYMPPSGVHDILVKEGDGSFKLTTQDRVVYDFDTQGRIASVADDHGLTTNWSYGSNGNVSTITDPANQSLTFTYNGQNQITKVTDSAGREVNFTYTAAGDLDTVTDPLGGVTNYDYDLSRRLKSIIDPRNVTFLANTYDSQGRVIEQRDGENNLWTLEYSAGETEVTDPEGGTKSFAFDSLKRLTAETDQLGNITTYGYDAAGNVDQINRPGGAGWSFDYDSAGNLTSATDPMGGTRTITYDGENHPTSFTDPRLKTWLYTWTGEDLTRITDPADGETDFTYNAAGQPLTTTDPNDHTTELAYDARGNLTSRTDPLDHTTSYGYNTRNHLTSETEPGKPAETYTRNALGDLLSMTTPEGNTTSYEYDGNGAPIRITDPALKVWTIERDRMERPTAYVDPLNNRTEIAYDGNLNPTSVTDRRDKTTTYSYDLANRLTGIGLPEGGSRQFGYDARGNRNSVTDPRSNTTTYAYDLNDRMTAANEPLATTTAYGYDAAGNLTSITDPRSNQTAFGYDDLGRMTGISQPLGKVTGFTYDPAGNLLSRITQEDALSYSYDAADRLTGISDGTNPLRSFAYDAADRMTAATDAQAKALAIGYDSDDRVTSIDDDRGQTVALSYDSRGNLTQQTDGRGTVQYGYDELSRMTSLTDPQSGMLDFTYDPEGNLTQTELPNGVVTTNAYDGEGRMTNTSSEKATTVLQSFAYAYDAAGNRTAQTDRNNETTTYAHDALNRLTEFDPPTGPAVAYGYDAAGNRTQADGVTHSYNALNQLTGSSDGTAYDYDDAGRLVGRSNGSQTTTYAWDPLDQLSEVDDGSNPISYTYDALGRRSERTEGTATTTAHYEDLSDRPILESNSTPSVTRSYVQGPAGLVEERSGSATTYPLPDAHGDVTTVTDQEGAVSSRQEYDPWGSQLSGPELENGYLGAHQRPTDPDTDLLQMGARPYDPTLGQFLEEDPVLGLMGLGQSLSRYPYAWDNPLNLYDLNGRSVCEHIGDFLGSACEYYEDGPELSDLGAIDEMPAAAGEWWGDRAEEFIKQIDFSTEEFVANVAAIAAGAGTCAAATGAATAVGTPAAGVAAAATCAAADAITAGGAVNDIFDEDNSLWTDDLF